MITAIIQNYSNGVLVSTSELFERSSCQYVRIQWRLLYGMDERKRKQLTLSEEKSAGKDTLKVGVSRCLLPSLWGRGEGEGLLVRCLLFY